MPLSFEGIVYEKFLDSNDRMTPKVSLMVGNVCPIYAYDAWDYIQIGDSLSKPAGSLKHTIYRKGSLPVSFYPKMDGKEVR
ncbi:hypothetical protein F0919_03905 [Taibaiella lutea]|uniref:Uncharacterized protein n=1 Tax=Taibaiella lutea TaxID=2608001 RepID=A0A5M6CNV9_9BACT|nr:hypothetical protein [Taibaiella lutea]KAA5536824.1 hypothetical protein F0919_03905 [Taibaiella lutea]